MTTHSPQQQQLDRFKEAALECDEDEARWEEKLRKVVKQKDEKRKPTDSKSR